MSNIPASSPVGTLQLVLKIDEGSETRLDFRRIYSYKAAAHLFANINITCAYKTIM